jgi:hypothetical protein
MLKLLDPFRFLLTSLAGWMNQHQVQAIDYLREENRVLREQLGSRRLRLTDDQRRRLAVKAKGLGRQMDCEWSKSEGTSPTLKPESSLAKAI